jgi:hypothetical protein
MVNDDAKLQPAIAVANAGLHEVEDYVDELEPACWPAGRLRVAVCVLPDHNSI